MSPGIPTRHKGRQYRSRLEARWASFFDALGWRYEYEPFDLDGWIPDFLLIGPVPILVEVKPVVAFPEDVADKIRRSGVTERVLILGCTIPIRPLRPHVTVGDDGAIGWLLRTVVDCRYWTDVVVCEADEGGMAGRWSLAWWDGPKIDLISGADMRRGMFLDSDEIDRLWAEAGNRTQWKAPR